MSHKLLPEQEHLNNHWSSKEEVIRTVRLTAMRLWCNFLRLRDKWVKIKMWRLSKMRTVCWANITDGSRSMKKMQTENRLLRHIRSRILFRGIDWNLIGWESLSIRAWILSVIKSLLSILSMTLIWKTILMHSVCGVPWRTPSTETLQTTYNCTSRTTLFNSTQDQVQPLFPSECASKPRQILVGRPPWDRACNTRVRNSLWLAWPLQTMENHSLISKAACLPNKTR